MSAVEAVANVVVGYGIAVISQILLFRALGIDVSLRESLVVGVVFTIVSIARSFALRRLFEHIRMHGLEREAAAL
jgi:hypothetical protein